MTSHLMGRLLISHDYCGNAMHGGTYVAILFEWVASAETPKLYQPFCSVTKICLSNFTHYNYSSEYFCQTSRDPQDYHV